MSLHQQNALQPQSPSDLEIIDNLSVRADELFEDGDLDGVIELYRRALESQLPLNSTSRIDPLNSLAEALILRFDYLGQLNDLVEALSLFRQALTLVLQCPKHPKVHRSLSYVATAITQMYQHTGQQQDLDEAVALYRQALDFMEQTMPSDRPALLSSLASALDMQFEIKGQLDILEEAILLHREALELQPQLPHHAPRSIILHNLANALKLRFEHGGQQQDIDEAILYRREALDLRPAPHPDRFQSLIGLATELRNRFRYRNQQEDLNEAILLHRQALELQPPADRDMFDALTELATALHYQFLRDGRQQNLDEAISLHRESLKLRPPQHPHRYICLNGLANALAVRCEQGHGDQQQYMDEVLALYREVLELQDSQHPDYPASLLNLSVALMIQFKHSGQQDDLDEAIQKCQSALNFTAYRHPYQSTIYSTLGMIYSFKYESLNSVSRVDSEGSRYLIEKIISSFSSAVHCSSQGSSELFSRAKTWAMCAHTLRHSSSLGAYTIALEALTQLASLGLDMQTRQDLLTTGGGQGFSSQAAKCAIENNRLDMAIQFLETGRAVLWSQVLQLRSPFDKLQDISPELGNRLRDLAIALEQGSHRGKVISYILDNHTKMNSEAEAAKFQRLNEDWMKGLQEARQIQGFEDFLRPLSFSSLQASSTGVPVVFLIPNEFGSDCLIMTSCIVHRIGISKLTMADLNTLVHLIQCAASPSGRSFRDQITDNDSDIPTATREAMNTWMEERLKGKRVSRDISPDAIFESILSTLWFEVVKPVIDVLELQKKENALVRLQWCPIGPFTFLPIHAAGSYNSGADIECASDYFVSSYTPTAGALLLPDITLDLESPLEMMTVRDTSLYHVQEEMEKIALRIPKGCKMLNFGTADAPALVEGVHSGLQTASIAHFSCHGTQDRATPLASSLHLKDGRLTIAKIMRQPYPHGALAFLCACETAMGAKDIPDEAMNLGASLIFSGFRNVVATMWRMADLDGPTVSDAFYEELFRGPDGAPCPRPDFNRSAYALDIAVKKLRASGVPFKRWIPFIHLGK